MAMRTDTEHKQEAPRSVNAYVITVSDTRTAATDTSGSLIRRLLENNNHTVTGQVIVRDEPRDIARLIENALKNRKVDVIVLTGGTGISSRDSTYEVVGQFLQKKIDGFGELFRYLSYEEIGSAAMMSRAAAGVARGKVIISLPGSEDAVRLAMNRLVIPELTHMVGLVRK